VSSSIKGDKSQNVLKHTNIASTQARAIQTQHCCTRSSYRNFAGPTPKVQNLSNSHWSLSNIPKRSAKRPWNPSFSLAVRILLIIRVAGAMYSNIQDCDEGTRSRYQCCVIGLWAGIVFNFWEPLHYLDRGYGFQTWEVSPVYAIRSWAYIILHLLPARIPAIIIGPDKVRP
jgi:alpha-1,2-mannosyltransferase